MRLYRAFLTLGAITSFSRVLGFLRDLLIAHLLGAGSAADAFFIAFRAPNLFRRSFAEGAFDAAFVPLFAKRLHGDDPTAAKAFAEQALAGLIVILVIGIAVGEIGMPWFMLVLAPGFAAEPAKYDLAVLLARIALPYLLCMSVLALYAGVLNAYGRFAAAALSLTLLNVVLIIAMLGLAAAGVVDQRTAVIVLACAILVSGLLQVAVVVAAAAKIGVRFSLRRPSFGGDMQKLLWLALPGFVAGGMAQINILICSILASLQDRLVSWLYYADRIFQLPLGVVGVAISVALLPELSHKLRSGDHVAAIDSENRSLEIALLLTLPASVALFLAAHPIIHVLFEHGAFTAIDANATASLLSMLALGLPAYVLVKVLQTGFFAREDTKTPMLLAGIGMLLNIGFSLVLFIPLRGVGLALAATLSGWINVLLLIRTLKARELFAVDALLRRRFVAIVTASLIMGIVVFALETLLQPWFTRDSLPLEVVALALLIGAGLTVYGVAAELLGAIELRPFLKGLKRAEKAAEACAASDPTP